MSVDPKLIVRKLTPTVTRMLETAVGRSANATHYEVTVEHVLRAILDPEDGDCASPRRRDFPSPSPIAHHPRVSPSPSTSQNTRTYTKGDEVGMITPADKSMLCTNSGIVPNSQSQTSWTPPSTSPPRTPRRTWRT